jgi:hypothetical protein
LEGVLTTVFGAQSLTELELMHMVKGTYKLQNDCFVSSGSVRSFVLLPRFQTCFLLLAEEFDLESGVFEEGAKKILLAAGGATQGRQGLVCRGWVTLSRPSLCF